MQQYQQSRHALGSVATLTIVGGTVAPDAVFVALWDSIDAFERRFSRFLPDSELSRFNTAAGHNRSVSPEFRALLLASQSLSRKTGGLYNPFILPALQRAGYKSSWPSPAAPQASNLDHTSRSVVDIDKLHIGLETARIPSGTALDFGGIGKGYLLDQLGAYLTEQGIDNYWLSLGGDILCAGHDASGEPWQIGIQHATRTNTIAATVACNDKPMAVATSGITKRQGGSGASAWHHLIDPRTGQSADTDILTATVCAGSATEADVYAKCLVIVGTDKVPAHMKKYGLHNVLLQQCAPEREVRVIQKGTIWSA